MNRDREAIRVFLGFQGAYHNHKEQLGYLAAAFYLSGALWVTFGWEKLPPWAHSCSFGALIVATAVFGWLYVWLQFYQRAIAASRIDWFIEQLDPGLNWPPKPERGLASFIEDRRNRWLWRWAAPMTSLAVMLIWAIAASIRVFGS